MDFVVKKALLEIIKSWKSLKISRIFAMVVIVMFYP